MGGVRGVLLKIYLKMKRQIKFRGKSQFGKHEWLYGYFLKRNGSSYIVPDKMDQSLGFYQVIPETLGQFTGLLDKNGKEVWEGDILAYAGKEFLTEVVEFGYYNENGSNCAPSDNYGWFLKIIQCQGEPFKNPDHPLHSIDGIASHWPKHCADNPQGVAHFKLETIGNIHDAPHMLKGEVEDGKSQIL